MDDSLAATVNRARLDSLVDEIGDRDIVRQAVQSFLDELVERLQAIRTAIGGGDPDVIRRDAHALGSPAAMLGATEVTRVCRTMEAQNTEGDAVLVPLMTELDAVAARTVSELRSYLEAESAV
ncbi:MAG: Hpt domain-containing protein [Actinobacteria bacterium]|jgi:HPt (histidine-containing phosphotransfer) domain-containing protein|nr:Hpt domain-containing protein [Actinomycetota bacterium]